MTKERNDNAPTSISKPEELETEALDKANGGWGRHCYTSYSSDSSASYTARSSDKGGASSLRPWRS